MNVTKPHLNRLLRWACMALLGVVLTACSSLSRQPGGIDCTASDASCHYGRFGLLWKAVDDQGQVKAESVSGSYEWRSGYAAQGDRPPVELAYLEVNSTLGPSLGQAKRNGNYYEVRAADGRVYLAQDWQSLFDLMFPVSLPADALVNWMKNPNPDNLPPLPDHWKWQNSEGRYRVLFVQNNTSGRIDLIPQGKIGR
ncbi:MAG TPA: hypothetical protein VGE55_01380 [Limnobacter sp.]|uniref:hypothetical protein n=1 Tax=Limnobacter sp. TaxID=2003368 RepID=UPI002ED8E6F0